jgi:hypothetical protein
MTTIGGLFEYVRVKVSNFSIEAIKIYFPCIIERRTKVLFLLFFLASNYIDGKRERKSLKTLTVVSKLGRYIGFTRIVLRVFPYFVI